MLAMVVHQCPRRILRWPASDDIFVLLPEARGLDHFEMVPFYSPRPFFPVDWIILKWSHSILHDPSFLSAWAASWNAFLDDSMWDPADACRKTSSELRRKRSTSTTAKSVSFAPEFTLFSGFECSSDWTTEHLPVEALHNLGPCDHLDAFQIEIQLMLISIATKF